MTANSMLQQVLDQVHSQFTQKNDDTATPYITGDAVGALKDIKDIYVQRQKNWLKGNAAQVDDSFGQMCGRVQKLFDVRGDVPRPTALAGVVRALAEGRAPDHPVIAGDGWWQNAARPGLRRQELA